MHAFNLALSSLLFFLLRFKIWYGRETSWNFDIKCLTIFFSTHVTHHSVQMSCKAAARLFARPYIIELKKKLYVNPDPKSKSCDFQAAVFIFMSRRLILNCLNYSLLHLHQRCFQLHHIRRESFVQQFFFQGTASFSQSHGEAILKHGRKN